MRSVPRSCATVRNGLEFEKLKTPPGRKTLATSGTVLYASQKVMAPQSQKTTSKARSRKGRCSASARTRGYGRRRCD
jgi:hypothetical protein